MPAGDPAGYLPTVIRKRLRKSGAKAYKLRSKQPKATIKVPTRFRNVKIKKKAPPSPTGGVEAPAPYTGEKKVAKPYKAPRVPRGSAGARRYFGRSK